MAKTKKRTATSHRSTDSTGLPPGWIRVESRSKPGAFFYAHPATKRTQTEHPGQRQVRSKRPEGPRRQKAEDEAKGSPLEVEDTEDPAEKAERLRQEAEAAEAEEAARQELVRQQRAAKRALLKADEKKEDEPGSDEERELVSKEELEKWKEDEERREKEEAEAERRRKEEEERRRKEAEEAERRRIEEEERVRKEREEEIRRIEAEKIALWKARTAMARKEAEFELAVSRERQKKEEADKRLLEAERVRQALLEKKQQEAEEETKKAEAELRRKAEAERLRREFEAQNQQNERIPEPSDPISVPCFDVFKSGNRIGRFILSPSQKCWTIGRCPPVDIRAGHETVSRKHAQVNRQGCFTFLQDLGSAHGTVLNGQKISKNTLERLCSGDNLRFGGSTRTYVYREPDTALPINSRSMHLKPAGDQKEVVEPPLESPRVVPGQRPSEQTASLAAPVSLASPVPKAAALSPASPPLRLESPRVEGEISEGSAIRIASPEPLAPPKADSPEEAAEASQAQQQLKIDAAQKASKPSSSSSSSSSSGKKRKRKKSKSSSASRKKKKKKSSSSSSSSSSSREKKKKESKKRKRKSSSTSASTEKKKKKRKSSSS